MFSENYQQVSLLIQYLSLIGIWFAIPSISLLLSRDKRSSIAMGMLVLISIVILAAFFLQWRILFPKFKR